MIGKTISHYRIIEKLGEGGMGVVYKAEDMKLGRLVALKFLPAELTRDNDAKNRFIHEARAASALQHHNICTIHEIDETPEGQLFIAMDCYEGKTLKDKIATGPLPVEEALNIASQVAAGLSKAHEAGMVHRDIKPANIMVTTDGEVKLLDFGLAKLAGQTKLTRTGTTPGTVAYMSPEQAKGVEVDARSDIFSLGAVLYEMLTGEVPFPGEHEAAVLYGIIHTPAEPMEKLKEGIPRGLQRVVDKALEKDPSGRYPNAAAMAGDLASLAREVPRSVRTASGRRGRSRRALSMALVSAVVVITGAVLLIRNSPKSPRPTSSARKMIVVLPFENLGSPDDEYFANGTTDAITARLARVSGLGVISRQSAIQYRKTTKTIRQIGSELGVDYVLEGTVQRERPGDPASRVRVIPQLIRVTDNTHVWADTYDEDMKELFRVQSDIAQKVATQLDITLLEPERRAIEKRPTENLAAYESYLRGMDFFYEAKTVANEELSVKLLEHAVSLDPQFAEAWAGLAMPYHTLYWYFDRPGALAKEIGAAKRAEELAPDLPETQLAIGFVAYASREFEKALAHFERAQRLRPTGDAAMAIGWTMRRLGRWQDALKQSEEAHRLIPRSYHVVVDALGETNARMRRFDEAEQYTNEAISISPHLSEAYVRKARVLAARDGDVDGARLVLSEMSRRTNPADAAEYGLGQGDLPMDEYRLFPETFTEVFVAFESGPMERYRGIQPAQIANAHLARATLYEAMGDRQSASARYDSARVSFELVIRSNPQSAFVCAYHSNLGRAYAGLGRCEEAIREGQEAVRMVPISKDALEGTDLVISLAEICVKCGKYDAAIDQIETLLSVPSKISPGLLRVDPIWDPIRGNPRFRRLVEGK
jgi:serine/threonine protein kinase/tetratricopeptide (TPR) repeat protein